MGTNRWCGAHALSTRSCASSPSNTRCSFDPLGKMMATSLCHGKLKWRPLTKAFSRSLALQSVRPVNDGKQVVLQFADNSQYEVHSPWLKDASPDLVGADFYRKRAADVNEVRTYKAVDAKINEAGQLAVKFAGSEGTTTSVYEADWLHAFAPFVGKPLNGNSNTADALVGTGSMFDDLYKTRNPWLADEIEIPRFDAEMLRDDLDTQVRFLETAVDPGFAIIDNVGGPEDLNDRHTVGLPMEDLLKHAIGRFNQHPIRSTRYGVMRA